MIILWTFAFVSGLITIFAPCIWPILPLILSSSTTGGHKKPLGLTLGIIISFGFLTLTISYIVKIIPFDPNILRYFAVFVIGILGLSLIIPKLSEILEVYVSRLVGKIGISKNGQKTGFWAGFITGLALGVVWAPCAGPILATIATLAATQSVNLGTVLVTFFYLLGISIPLFIFATFGNRLFTKSRGLSKYTGKVQQIFGVIMILTAILIATNYDKVLEVKLLDVFPSYGQFVNNFEGNPLVKTQLNDLKGIGSQNNNSQSGESDLFNTNTKAPDFVGIEKWLNTEKPIKINDLKGKVVLVDFWTYTCINCIRTLPYVTSWYDKYKDAGFVVIGIHTPEFEFEHNTQNVLNAIKQFKIHYPVAQDNNYSTWNNYSNSYWPAEYLVDANGNIRRTHFGEGEYDKMELAIQTLLKKKGAKINSSLENIQDQTPTTQLSPETYVGAKRMEFYYPLGNTGIVNQNFTITDNLPTNSFSLGGNWNILDDNALTGKNAILNYNFYADKVFLVLRPGSAKNAKVKVFLDGKTVDSTNQGADVKDGEVFVDSDRLYSLIDLKGKPGNHILKLEFQDSGIEVFAFTFG
ncbi:MAG TPA: cytochrome c biogenesis protein DipZ [Candidatus Sulfotelmatobacter sp.]|nr:cytochrome c biogenesis protein DipZ [Candidatus Sulfotelmatobacter sp.]